LADVWHEPEQGRMDPELSDLKGRFELSHAGTSIFKCVG
jgi:hypothetical protein